MSDECEHIPGFDDGPLPSADGAYPPKPSRQKIDARAAKGQSRKTGQPFYIAKYPALFKAGDAWRGMTAAAKAVVERIEIEFCKTRSDRRRNGSIAVTYHDFAIYGVRRPSIPGAVERAEELGFIFFKRGHRADAQGRAANQHGNVRAWI